MNQYPPSATTVTPKPRRQDSRFAHNLVVAIHHTFAFAPLAAFAAVYLLSWRIASIIGHWPVVWMDDPKYSAPGDLLSTLLYFSVLPLLMWSVGGLIAFPGLTILLRRKYPLAWTLLLVVAFIAGLVLLRLDPGDRITWYFD